MSKVYILWARTEYEPSTIVGIFASEISAKERLEKIERQLLSRPEWPGDGTESEEDGAWERLEKWREDNPDAFCCEYSDTRQIEEFDRQGSQLPQDVEEFIAENAREVSYGRDSVMRDVRGDAVDVYSLRAWMTGHVRVPAEMLSKGGINSVIIEPPEVKGRVMSEMFWRGVYAAQKAMLNASKGEPEPDLWCVHILGPDDLHAAPSKAYAEVAADLHNRQLADLSAKLDIVCKAVVAPWPYSAESHAEDVVSFIDDWFMLEPIVSRAKASKGE